MSRTKRPRLGTGQDCSKFGCSYHALECTSLKKEAPFQKEPFSELKCAED